MIAGEVTALVLKQPIQDTCSQRQYDLHESYLTSVIITPGVCQAGPIASCWCMILCHDSD